MQISFIRPEIKLHSAPRLYQPSPYFSALPPISPLIGATKSFQHGPLQFTYALQSPIDYTLAIAPISHHNQNHASAIRPQVYLATSHHSGGIAASASSPSVFLAVPQNLAQPQIEKNRIIQYVIMPAHELSLAKYLSSQSLIAPHHAPQSPLPSSSPLYHQPVYG